MIPVQETAGESTALVRRVHTGRGPAVLPPIEVHPDALLSNWRKLVCASGLTGLAREVTAGSVVVTLDEGSVLLRPRSNALVTPELHSQIRSAIARAAKNPDFKVKFDALEHDGTAATVSLWEESVRREARIALIEAFKSDPFVQKCLVALDGTLDETSVRLIDDTDF